MIKFATEGYPFIIVFSIISLAAYLFAGPFLAIVPVALTLFMFYFFRDPDRNIPSAENIFVSPADGKIILIREVFENEYLHANTKELSIFMSPLNVHVNRSPCEGIVKMTKHSPGKFIAAYKDDASLINENIAMVLETRNDGHILVRQVAGFIARRAVCRVKVGDYLQRGQRYGIIKFSSRLDVYLPASADIKVELGDTVKAGETILCVMDSIIKK